MKEKLSNLSLIKLKEKKNKQKQKSTVFYIIKSVIEKKLKFNKNMKKNNCR